MLSRTPRGLRLDGRRWTRTTASRPAGAAKAASAEARRLNGAAGLLAASVLADSAVEHYRGSFQNPAMYVPLAAAALSLFGSADGAARRGGGQKRLRRAIYEAAAAVGLAGTGFHLYNVVKRPGRLSWLNLFYGAPLGAPMALTLSGAFGLAAERVRDTPPKVAPEILGLPAGRLLAALTAAGLAGTVAEAALLHFRGAFQNPAMYLPVSLPPVASGLMAGAALWPRRRHWLARAWLGLTAALGLAGTGFHAYGVSRAMGGWRNWRQNVVDGPPLPAPPSFTALALAGLAALALLEGHADE